MRRSPAGQAARGPAIVTSDAVAGEPDSATMPPPGRLSAASSSRFRTTRAAGGGSARRGSRPVRSSRTRGSRQAVREAVQPGQVQRRRHPGPRRPAAASGAGQLDRGFLRQRQRLAVRLLLAGDLQHPDQRAQRTAQIMAEAGSRAVPPGAALRSCRSSESLPQRKRLHVCREISHAIYGPAACARVEAPAST